MVGLFHFFHSRIYWKTHALFKGRAFLSLLYCMLEISVPKLQITSLTSKKFPKQIALFKENRQALQMQGICSCASPGASTMMLDCWIIISQLPMTWFSEVSWSAPASWSILVNLQGRSRAPRPSQSHEFTGVGLEAQRLEPVEIGPWPLLSLVERSGLPG